LLDVADPKHAVCQELLVRYPGPLAVPALCIAEVAYIASRRLGWDTEVRFLGALTAGDLTVEQLHPADLERIAELVSAYRDLPLGTTDASVVAAAERLDVTTIATLDKRHFSVVRPAHADSFELVP
jgi:predicted nucleic acid-binding protein